MEWLQVTLYVAPESVDAVIERLYGLDVKGVEVQDNVLTDLERAELFVDYVADELVPFDETRIICYFSEEEDLEERLEAIKIQLSDLRNYMNVGSGRIETQNTQEEDWANNWKQYYKPFRLADNILIQPIWEEVKAEEGDQVIFIDPGMAFGSGTHETTSMCVELIKQHRGQCESLIDVGCGSGILSLVAGRLGFERAVGIDIDVNAVKVAKENVVSNQLEDRVKILHGNLIDDIDFKADMVVANIMADVIMMLTPSIRGVLKDKGTFISSGIIHSKIDGVCSVLEANAFTIHEVYKKGEWAAIVATLEG